MYNINYKEFKEIEKQILFKKVSDIDVVRPDHRKQLGSAVPSDFCILNQTLFFRGDPKHQLLEEGR